MKKLGFGCMRLPMKGDAIDREQALAMFDYAYQHGVNYYDTAWPYLGGTSEPFVGEALSRYPRDSFFLASKMPVWLVESEADFERIFEEQLVRLKTDHIDFYLLHALSKARFDKVLEQGLYDLCRKKQQEGKIRYIGSAPFCGGPAAPPPAACPVPVARRRLPAAPSSNFPCQSGCPAGRQNSSPAAAASPAPSGRGQTAALLPVYRSCRIPQMRSFLGSV